MINIAVMGHGVVGSGVCEVFYENRSLIERHIGKSIDIKYVLDIRDFNDVSYSDRFIKDFDVLLNDEDVSVVAEVMGGVTFAYTYVKACLKAGKSVVTSNKQLVAEHGEELVRLARKHKVSFLFEGSVGGGMPVIMPLYEGLSANAVNSIVGILNGTTNFILTRMISKGLSFDEALALAQSLGYAERDPSSDIEGDDACRKIAILSSIAFGGHVSPKDVRTVGISAVEDTDIAYAKAIDCTVKLIGQSINGEHRYVWVEPSFVPEGHRLFDVSGVFNGILINGSAVGDVVFEGMGAGKRPTASAVLSDIMLAIKAKRRPISPYWEGSVTLSDCRELAGRYFIRIKDGNEAILAPYGDIKRIHVHDGEQGVIIPDICPLDILKMGDAVVSYYRIVN